MLPVAQGAKYPPLEKDWPDRASAEPKQRARWEKAHPGCNWAVATGEGSGVLVVDCDSESARDALLSIHPALADAPCVKTPRGYHFYLAYPTGYGVRNSTSKLGTGIDVRSTGGYALLPPSRTAAGEYTWCDERDLIPAPRFLVEQLMGREQPQEPQTERSIPQGQRDSHMTSRAGALRRLNISYEQALQVLQDENRRLCDPPLPDGDIERIAKSVWRYPAGRVPKPSVVRRPDLVTLSEVTPEDLTWHLYPYIPLGKVVVIEGDPGCGKTYLVLSLCAAATVGKHPFTGEQDRQAVSVLFLTAEDGLADTIHPRLEKLGADLTRFVALRGTVQVVDGKEEKGSVWLSDITVLEEALERTHPALVVIDPFQGFLGAEVDMHRANEIRPILARLAGLAEKHKCAVLIIRHLSKGGQSRNLYRGLGSIDIVAAARSVLLAGNLPHDPEQRALIHMKSSLAPQGPAMGYRLGGPQGFEWTGPSSLTASDLLAPEQHKRGPKAISAEEFLHEALKDGPRLRSKIETSAKERGIAERTLRRAFDNLAVVTTRTKEFPARAMWSLPAEQIPLPASEEEL